MSVMTKGLGTLAEGGGAIVTKGLQTVVFIKPSFVPMLARAELSGDPDLVSANTPTSVYRMIMVWFRGLAYGN